MEISSAYGHIVINKDQDPDPVLFTNREGTVSGSVFCFAGCERDAKGADIILYPQLIVCGIGVERSCSPALLRGSVELPERILPQSVLFELCSDVLRADTVPAGEEVPEIIRIELFGQGFLHLGIIGNLSDCVLVFELAFDMLLMEFIVPVILYVLIENKSCDIAFCLFLLFLCELLT